MNPEKGNPKMMKDIEDAVPGVIAQNDLGPAYFDSLAFALDREVLVPDPSGVEDWDHVSIERERLRFDDIVFIINHDRGTLQVTRSAYTRECGWCSPCYPGQGDLASTVEPGYGACIAFDVPPEWRR